MTRERERESVQEKARGDRKPARVIERERENEK